MAGMRKHRSFRDGVARGSRDLHCSSHQGPKLAENGQTTFGGVNLKADASTRAGAGATLFLPRRDLTAPSTASLRSDIVRLAIEHWEDQLSTAVTVPARGRWKPGP
jgi:hypothetical protein